MSEDLTHKFWAEHCPEIWGKFIGRYQAPGIGVGHVRDDRGIKVFSNIYEATSEAALALCAALDKGRPPRTRSTVEVKEFFRPKAAQHRQRRG